MIYSTKSPVLAGSGTFWRSVAPCGRISKDADWRSFLLKAGDLARPAQGHAFLHWFKTRGFAMKET